MSKQNKRITKENLISNGEISNRGKFVHEFSIKVGDNFWIETADNFGRFTILSVDKDQGTQFVRSAGGVSGGEVIFEISYLRKQYASGKVKLYDENGGIVNHLV